MDFSHIWPYIALAFLLLLTAFNFRTIAKGQKKRKQGEETFRKVFRDLEEKTDGEMERNGLSFDEKHGYLNDASEGFFLSFDGKHRMMGIATLDDFHLIPYDEVRSCKVLSDPLENGKHTNIRAELETADGTLKFVFGTKEWKPKSHFGSFIFSDARQFCTFVEGHCTTA